MKKEPLICRVTAVHRQRFVLTAADGTQRYARLKMAAYRDAATQIYPTVGDFVQVHDVPDGDSLILETMPRTSYFIRKVAGKLVGTQAVAANFDEVFILASLNQDFNPRRIERYAAMAWESGGTPVLVLTKRDLVERADQQAYEAMQAAPGVDIHIVSAVTGEGLDALRQRLCLGKSVALLGSSGVGKSSLINALAGEPLMQTGQIRREDAKGRHTTTHRQMFQLPQGAWMIDTPGMRELGLWDAEEGLQEAFGDMNALAKACRFADCKHDQEPGCAVKAAVLAGNLDADRLKSYHKLRREAARRAKKEQIKAKR